MEAGDLSIERISSNAVEGSRNDIRRKGSTDSEVLPVVETNYPFFHLDLDDAVRSAERAALV